MKNFNKNILSRRYRNITKLTSDSEYENCYLIDGKIVVGTEEAEIRTDREAVIYFQSYGNGSYKKYPKPKTFIEFENQAKEYGHVLVVNNRQ